MEGVLMPRESGQLIAATSKDVTVQAEGVQKVAQLVCITALYLHSLRVFLLSALKNSVVVIKHYFSSRQVIWSHIRCLDFIFPELEARGIFNPVNVYETILPFWS